MRIRRFWCGRVGLPMARWRRARSGEHGGKVQGSQVPRHHVEVVEHYDIVGYGCC